MQNILQWIELFQSEFHTIIRKKMETTMQFQIMREKLFIVRG